MQSGARHLHHLALPAGQHRANRDGSTIAPTAPTATIVIIPAAPTVTVIIVPTAPTTTIVIIPAAPTTTVVITQRALIHVALITKHLRDRRKLALLIFVKAVVERPLRIREARQRGAHNADSDGTMPTVAVGAAGMMRIVAVGAVATMMTVAVGAGGASYTFAFGTRDGAASTLA